MKDKLLVTLFIDSSIKDGVVGFGYWFKFNNKSTTGGDVIWMPEGLENKTHLAEFMGITSSVSVVERTLKQPFDLLIQCDCLPALQLMKGLGAAFAKTSKLQGKGIQPPRSMREYSSLFYKAKKGNLESVWLKHVKGHGSGKSSRSYVNIVTDNIARKFRSKVVK